MGFFKELIKSFTTNTDELIRQSNLEIAKSIKEKEGLNYIKLLNCNSVIGIEGMGQGSSVSLFDDRLRFRTSINDIKNVLFSDIESIEVMNDIQIQEKSKLGQMLVIGIFALATKKKTEEISKSKLVLNICEDGIRYSVIIDTIYDALTEAKNLNKVLLEYKSRVE